MKITTQLNKTADTLEINGNILKVSGVEYDLDNLNTKPEPNENGDIPEFADKCYIENGIEHLIVIVDKDRQFLAVNNNLMLFHDIDMNGDIDRTELQHFIECYSKSEEERRAEHKAFKESFTDEEWIERRKACGQLK